MIQISEISTIMPTNAPFNGDSLSCLFPSRYDPIDAQESALNWITTLFFPLL